jgi:hypothetical protein
LNKNLITHIQDKIKALKNEIKAIEYTNNDGLVLEDTDFKRIEECIHKIQILNEIIISFEIQK